MILISDSCNSVVAGARKRSLLVASAELQRLYGFFTVQRPQTFQSCTPAYNTLDRTTAAPRSNTEDDGGELEVVVLS